METDNTGGEEKASRGRTLDSTYTASQRQERQGSNLKLTKRPDGTKETTCIEPRRKFIRRKWLCRIRACRTGILFSVVELGITGKPWT